ncbi:chemoreceptor glutamine deamidase CheD [Pseudomarimonas arenosa]|uniref:Probable chemoreceptor glutamine deamidase CheD n=1 Tax=Pseudomarimonas arenosa TaxID=2774145 RepID=A0AAW3ZK78_9GAMM|nr:chemoreceptor glutamine deamidase CheD [Pseudomarimonas arenosa]MBD8524706.1 chemoreceptor glutamine deamidase CheD [Pseudomarimonas arenosa]
MKLRAARAFDPVANARSRASPLLYRDTQLNADVVKVLPAEYFCTERDLALMTVLGSCVAACIRDPIAKVGGMNHFMLPDGEVTDGVPARYGSHAMELLINELLKHGASRQRLEAKVFGGGNVLKGFTSQPVGTRNAEFVIAYLSNERVQVISQDLGGIHPRKVCFFPVTGRALVKRLPHAHDDVVAAEESAYKSRLQETPVSGSVELF